MYRILSPILKLPTRAYTRMRSRVASARMNEIRTITRRIIVINSAGALLFKKLRQSRKRDTDSNSFSFARESFAWRLIIMFPTR